MYILSYRLINLRNHSEAHSTDSYIAEILLNHIDEIDSMSIDKVAELCDVSKATLSKFVKKLGFDDYKEFREISRKENVRSGYYGYEDKLPMWRYIAKDGWEKYMSILQEDIRIFSDSIDQNSLQQLGKALYEYKEVAAFGSVYSQTVAMDFMYRMVDEGKYIRTYTDDIKQEEYLKNMGEDALVIIFSNSGQFLYGDGMKMQGRFKTYLKEKRGKIALITSNREAAEDTIVQYPILYQFASNVHSHTLIERLVMERIISEYLKYKESRREL